jgi:DNA invertase Pin-like site-specific DNA recombinase
MMNSIGSQTHDRKIGTAALYSRVARADDFAMETQRGRLLDFAKQQGHEDCMEYSDNGFNGLSLERPAFAKMEADIIEGKISTVIVRCLDRISRDYVLTDKWVSWLGKRGVSIIALDGSHEVIPMARIFGEAIRSKVENLARAKK